jgi:hypothetical protein
MMITNDDHTRCRTSTENMGAPFLACSWREKWGFSAAWSRTHRLEIELGRRGKIASGHSFIYARKGFLRERAIDGHTDH